MNQTDGFMNSIFTDEDLHLMDMNESEYPYHILYEEMKKRI